MQKMAKVKLTGNESQIRSFRLSKHLSLVEKNKQAKLNEKPRLISYYKL